MSIGFSYGRSDFPFIEAPGSRAYVYLRSVREGIFMRTRFCRVCGQQFQPVRFDALTCSTTCRIRKSRGFDLAYPGHHAAGSGPRAEDDPQCRG
jgi:hypothetical protein